MATIQGTGGNAAFPTGFNMKFNGWSATTNIETVDTTGFEDNGYRVRKPVILSMDGSATGTAEGGSSTPMPAALLAATADPDQAEGTITLTGETGNTYSFPAVITSVSHNRPHDGKYDITFSFESAGRITQTWA